MVNIIKAITQFSVAKGTPIEYSLFEYANVPNKYKIIRGPLYEDNSMMIMNTYQKMKKEEDFDISL